eukprot:249054-Chlamydomonas_euryale.AAC.13
MRASMLTGCVGLRAWCMHACVDADRMCGLAFFPQAPKFFVLPVSDNTKYTVVEYRDRLYSAIVQKKLNNKREQQARTGRTPGGQRRDQTRAQRGAPASGGQPRKSSTAPRANAHGRASSHHAHVPDVYDQGR